MEFGIRYNYSMKTMRHFEGHRVCRAWYTLTESAVEGAFLLLLAQFTVLPAVVTFQH